MVSAITEIIRCPAFVLPIFQLGIEPVQMVFDGWVFFNIDSGNIAVSVVRVN